MWHFFEITVAFATEFWNYSHQRLLFWSLCQLLHFIYAPFLLIGNEGKLWYRKTLVNYIVIQVNS